MTESKKAWVTPELIVLVRSKPEEAVLQACKQNWAEGGSIGPAAGNGSCNFVCALCSEYSFT